MKATEAFAPAKINLTLHVTGQRPDGYHLLDSLVMFADIGDRVTVAPDDRLTLEVEGRFAREVPGGEDNLVLRAARLFGVPAQILLHKNLPPAAGIGGGSSDAAAVLRALSAMSGREIPRDVLSLGADVPVCLLARAARMGGIGELAREVTGPPPVHAVLANPRVALPTPQVFGALARKANPFMTATGAQWRGTVGFCDWLAQQRNDLEPPARRIAPVIDHVLGDLSRLRGCLLSRMSGSGATCFGLFATRAEADAAAAVLSTRRPAWWVQPASLR